MASVVPCDPRIWVERDRPISHFDLGFTIADQMREITEALANVSGSPSSMLNCKRTSRIASFAVELGIVAIAQRTLSM